MLPRGIRNNNPLNIRIGNKWKGEVENPTDKDFEQFTCMRYGLRAGFVLLKRYIEHYHLENITEIIHRWAPNSENPTSKYIAFVSERSGIGALDKLSFNDRQTMVRLVEAMCYFENGMSVDVGLINDAYTIASYPI